MSKKLKICILGTDDLDWSEIPIKKHFSEYDWELVTINNATLEKSIDEISKKDYDLVVNFCEGMSAFGEPGLNVIESLERHRLAYTGAGPDFYEPSREAVKKACSESGILSPKGVTIFNTSELSAAVKDMQYPMIVKHHNGFGSVGLLKESRVTNFAELQKQSERMLKAYGGILIEEFIDGREFIVLVSENPDDTQNPVVYEPLEAVFSGSDTFKYETLKWSESYRFKYHSVNQQKINDKLKEIAKRLFLALNGSGYGRCDIRMKENGDIYVLEINPNSGIFFPENDPGDDDYILQNDPRGYKVFLDLLFRSALNRQKRKYGVRDSKF